MTIEIRLSGAAKAALQGAAADLLREAGGAEPVRTETGADDTAAKGDMLAIAALVIALPAAIAAAVDLTQRARIADKTRNFLEIAKKSDGSATLTAGDGASLDLSTAALDDVMDALYRG
jgi:hypothetical protein